METGKRGIQTIEQRQRQVIIRLTNENRKLRERVVILEAENKFLKEKLEKAMLYIEELQRVVFRKKHKQKGKDDDPLNQGQKGGGGNRSAESYRRAVPKPEDITDTEIHHADNCPDCQNELRRIKIVEFFQEDILSPDEWFKILKKVIRKQISIGFCPNCKKKVSQVPIPKQRVTLGENIRELIVFQSTIQQLSYSQIKEFANVCLRINISDGEIANILKNQANRLKPAFEDLKKNIRNQKGAHFDETGWKTSRGGLGDFVWAMCGIENKDVLYLFGKSRGKGNIAEMAGEQYEGIGISDNYGAYKNAFLKGKHALCWAHPHRKLRDLKDSDGLSEEKKENAKNTYREFAELYRKVRETNQQEFNRENRLEKSTELEREFDQITELHLNDPIKLKQIKNGLKVQKHCYFICITEPNIPPDNNKAERALRHLIIKRKKSFGSKTHKGAEVFSVLYSVVMSLWHRSKETFFSSYQSALSPAN
ncbi:MAG: hypothetical protein G01um101418_358 [Parcubacteria group bacterium Gr01-1014_18]|nr:MAG: hypothetical protein Greene041636_266 [Parcubacteria group bacterium Greene0416_36]TSC81218.1 MAG: hypothetical protein G01um101418_358 [Parcubacteria group bacterium Gr01-1014_18]TSC99215.1 MAG: hypothetical protein Greene101420_360 [Parcubacteria group bacterium Greene1014_20]TSD07427.1 MAG: hypothetical protein Greene07142_126 [Parcubacteria group bacterium Greene0714_2]